MGSKPGQRPGAVQLQVTIQLANAEAVVFLWNGEARESDIRLMMDRVTRVLGRVPGALPPFVGRIISPAHPDWPVEFPDSGQADPFLDSERN